MNSREWWTALPPKDVRKIRALQTEYERLAKRIDKAYATGRFGRVEDAEQRAAEIEELLVALHDHFSEAGEGGELEEMEASLEEDLAAIFMNPDRYPSRDAWLDAMQDAVRTALLWAGQDVHPTTEQALDLAKDAAARRMALRRSYRPSVGLGQPAVGPEGLVFFEDLDWPDGKRGWLVGVPPYAWEDERRGAVEGLRGPGLDSEEFGRGRLRPVHCIEMAVGADGFWDCLRPPLI